MEKGRPKAVGKGRDLGDEYLFYDRESDRLHVLNETAREVFVLCDGARTEEEIAASMAARFEVPAPEALFDARKLLAALVALGLVSYDP